MSLDQETISRRPDVMKPERANWAASSRPLANAGGSREFAMRAFDVVLTSVGLLFLLPLFFIIAVAIRLDSPGPILFIQKRVGRGGKTFPCYKFRSMFIDAEQRRKDLLAQNERSGPVFKMKNDPRVTRVGRLLRKSSLDELPQLLNVVIGHMSLVGPRPAIPSEVDEYTAHELERLSVPPGITGLWQVSGRASLSFERMIELDLYYAENRSLWMNIRLLAMTIPAVLTGRGAY